MGDHFAASLRRLRLRVGLTQEALAERSGVSVSTIRGLETGRRRNPQLASVRQLATALELQPGERDELLSAATGAPETLAVPTPRQLPASPAPFVGRKLELDRLDAALRVRPGQAATVVISALAGAGGIGKSWLVLHWAHRNADRFPDGQLFVDLQGFSPDSDPMDPAVAVRGFLDALGVEPDRIPAAPHAQAALFRSLVANKRMLLVLDNAADTAQITPLLPGGDSCTVAVTSRNRLSSLITGHGAHHVSVDTLTDTDARALLAARLGTTRIDAEPAAVGELVHLCGGFPLALSIIAGRAHTNPHLLLAELADELRDDALGVLDDADPAASLPAVLSLSHRALSDVEADVLGLLAIAPGPDIGLPAAGSLTGLGRSRTRSILRRLEQASLISQDATGRYRMHELIRRYATTADVADDKRTAALRRVLDFYTHTAHAAAHLLDPHREPIELASPVPARQPQILTDIPAAMDWFEAEHRNLLAAQRTCAAHALHDTAWKLAWTLNDFHYRRGHRHDQLAVWQIAVDSASQLPDPGAQILTHRLLGRAHVVLGHHQEAIDALNQALALSEQQNDRALQAQAHYTLASIQPDGRQALDHARRARDLYRGLDQPIAEANALNAVGWYAALLGDHDGTAREHCQAALALYQYHRDVAGQAQTLDSLGYIDHHSGHHQDAIQHYLQAISLYRDLDNTYETADTLDRLGHPYAALGRHDQARAVWRQARDLYRQQGRDQEADQLERQFDQDA